MKRVTFLWLWVCALLWGAGVQVWGAPVTFVVDGYKYISSVAEKANGLLCQPFPVG